MTEHKKYPPSQTGENRQKKVVTIEVRKPDNETLYNLESTIDSEIALLHRRQAVEGELTDKEFKKLVELVKMKEAMINLKRETKKTSAVEGLSYDELKEQARIIVEKVGENDEEDY